MPMKSSHQKFTTNAPVQPKKHEEWHSSLGQLDFSAPPDSEMVTEYVGWIDVMGVASALRRSLPMATNFIMKLHVAALRANGIESVKQPVSLFPMIDGIYVTCPRQDRILRFMSRVFKDISKNFLETKEPLYKFMIRGTLAYGPIMKGITVTGGSKLLEQNANYRSRVLLGSPVEQTHTLEAHAPPFGIALHDSVRTFAPKDSSVLGGLHWRWWTWDDYGTNTDDIADPLLSAVKEHLDWCRSHSGSLMYQPERIKAHKELAIDYLTSVPTTF